MSGTITKFLDQGFDSEVAEGILSTVEEAGYSPEEAIPGLILAITLLAEKCRFPEHVLDEAANLLADGPAVSETIYPEDD